MAGQGRVVAVVVTYNRLGKLRDTLAALRGADPAHLARILVVDNASTDGTADWLAGQDDTRLDVLRLDTNSGGAGGFAAGMEAAVARHDPGWLLLSDDDGRPDPGALAAFHAAPRDADAAYAAAVRFPSGAICDMNRPGLNPFARPRVALDVLRRGRDGYHMTAADFDGPPREVDNASFVGLFVPRAALDRVGLPDARLFLYGDDALYTLAMRRAGMRVIFDPGLTFTHDIETQTDAGPGPVRPLWKVYYFHRNRLFMYRYAAGPWFWLLGPAMAALWWQQARRYGPDRAAYRRLARAGIADGFRGRTDRSFDEVRAIEAP